MLGGMFDKIRSLVGGEEIAVEERRAVIRLRCSIPVLAEGGGSQQRCNVTDIGLKGIRVEGLEGVKKGTELSVHYAGPDHKAPQGGVLCRVIWTRRMTRGMSAGLQYIERDDRMAHSWVRWSLQKLGFTQNRIQERRKWMRVPADVRVSLCSLQDEILTDCALADLSMGGALVASNVHVEAKTRLRLAIGPVGGMKVLKVQVTILATREDRTRRVFYLRSQFQNLEPHDEKLLRRYIAYCKKAQG
ncbi:MAG: PilZ domain-containing protein [Candidatus Eremiobacterota bacterium]